MLYKYKFIAYLISIVILLFLAGAVVFIIFKPKAPVGLDLKEETLNYIQGNSLMAYSSPYTPCMNTYGMEIRPDTLERLCPIVFCESDEDPFVCNKQYGCIAGMGLCQLIPSTLRYCEEKLGRKLDPFDPRDNLECGVWLLENEGDYHWNQSKKCWNK